MSLEGLFGVQTIEFLQRFLIEEFIKIDQQGKLKDDQKSFVSKCIHIHLKSYSKILPIESQLDSTQHHKSSENKQKRPVKHFLSEGIQESHIVSRQAHQIFFVYLNESMKRLLIFREISQVCRSQMVWRSESSIKSFLQRLIAIKMFFPGYFPSIIKQFIEKIEKLSLIETTRLKEIYAKQILIPRYLNCLKIYTASDDILAAAEQLYKLPKKYIICNKSNDFEKFQRQIRNKAELFSLQKKWDLQQKQQMKKYKQGFPLNEGFQIINQFSNENMQLSRIDCIQNKRIPKNQCSQQQINLYNKVSFTILGKGKRQSDVFGDYQNP